MYIVEHKEHLSLSFPRVSLCNVYYVSVCMRVCVCFIFTRVSNELLFSHNGHPRVEDLDLSRTRNKNPVERLRV